MTDDTTTAAEHRTPGDESEPRPRIRVGAAVWGAIVAAAAGVLLWTLVSPARRAATVDWLLELTTLAIGGILAIAGGAAVALIALVAVVRRAQLRRGGSR